MISTDQCATLHRAKVISLTGGDEREVHPLKKQDHPLTIQQEQVRNCIFQVSILTLGRTRGEGKWMPIKKIYINFPFKKS